VVALNPQTQKLGHLDLRLVYRPPCPPQVVQNRKECMLSKTGEGSLLQLNS